jgi:hypothetical protein
LRKKFVLTTIAGCAFLAWLFNTALGGIVYATAAFFTKEVWERWKSRRKSRD